MKNKAIVLGIGILVVLVALFKFGGSFLEGLLGEDLKPYKAVTLTTGVSYFGKISTQDQNSLTLAGVFYLRNKAGSPVAKVATPSASLANMELVDLGTDVYGSKDSLVINKRYVVSIQDLKPDSPIVTAIGKYISTRSGTGSTGSGQVEVGNK